MALIRFVFLLLAALAAAHGAQAQVGFVASAGARVLSATAVITAVGVGAAANIGAGACPRTISPGTPAGVAGDLLVAVVVSRDTGTLTPKPEQAWSTKFTLDASATHRARIYYRIADGSASDNLTVEKTGTCTNVMLGQIARFSGVDPAQPFEATVLSNFRGNSSTIDHNGGTINASVANSMSLFAATTSNNEASNTPAGFTEAFDSGTGTGSDAQVALYYRQETTTGNKGPVSTTVNGGETEDNTGIFMILRATPGAVPGSLTVPVPAGTTTNHVMIASITYRPCSSISGAACTTTITPPAGWTAIGTTIDQTTGAGTDGFGNRLAMYYRVATGAEPAAYTWTFGGTPVHAGAAGGILTFSGVDLLSPVVANQGAVTASSLTHVAPSINTGTTTNTMLVHAFTINSSGAWTPPVGSTERVDVSSRTPNNALGLTLGINTEPRAAAGSTGTRSATLAGPPGDTGATWMLALRPAAGRDHYSISHGGSGVACSDHTVTITAHNNAHAATDAGQATITLSTTNGKGSWVGIVAGGGTLADTTPGDGIAQYTFAAGSSAAQLSFRYANLAATSETFGFNVTDGAATETSGAATAADDPNFTMAQAGFLFRNTTDANTTIPTQISGKNSDTGFNARTLRIAAVRTDTNGACAGVFASATRTVDIGAECNNPATCAALQMALNGTALSTSADNGGAGASAYTAVSLTFDANSESAIVLNYPDAGQMSLHARHDLDPLVAGYEMIGSSNAFVVRPFGLGFTGITHGTDHTSAAGYTAGTNFSMTVEAYRWAAGEDTDNNGIPDAGVNITDNLTTPNFAATVTVAPETGSSVPGVALGAVSRGVTCASAGTFAMTGGTATIADWCYSETGNVRFRATATGYITGGVDIEGNTGHDGTGGGASAGRVGRFKPGQFAVSAGALTNRSVAACVPASAFSYMDEGLGLAFTLTAQNAQGNTTQNYSGAYALLNLGTFTNLGLGARSGTTNLTGRIDAGSSSSGTWGSGTVNATVTTAIRRATPDSPDGPYTGVAFGIAPTDADGTAMNALDLDVDNNAANDRKSLGVSTELRFGRLRMDNALGSERLAIPVPIRVEYWAGKGFTTNTLDSCTTIGRDQIALDFTPASNLTACETAITTASVAFASGVGSLTLSAPGAGNNGTVLLTPQLRSAAAGSYCPGPTVITSSALKSYLLGRWNDASNPDADPNTSYDDNPAVRAAFGIYGSQPSKYIYLRENY